MICAACGHSWQVRQAHVIRSERTPEGWRELILCPKCGRVKAVIRPDVGAGNGD